MSHYRCGAKLVLDSGGTATCDRWSDMHQGLDHLESASGEKWPACSQFCIVNHVHGRYRMKMGTPPKPTARPRPAKQKRCNACLSTERDLDKYGVCVDRAACESAAPPLFPSSSGGDPT